MNFLEKLALAGKKNRSLLCVGLDPDPALMPEKIGLFEFNKAIIDATADLVCAYKPNIAFYEAEGNKGLEALYRTREYIPAEIPVIIDAKRGDIGNTARAYARSLFERFNFDAATVSPYLGYDSLEPFLRFRDRGVFVLCRTSNKSAEDLQSLPVKTARGHQMLFEIVAEKVQEWNKNGNLGLVVGATYPEELKLIRDRYPEMPLLIPGVGAQGGELGQVVACGVDAGREKTVINVSRQVLYASSGRDFAAAAKREAGALRDKINEYLGA
ncbi:MAG: orotidine-5'-phosphate decarboxylase [Dehalococcoidales bacterium]|jgi:orotidine-5'-phosphate decarboxylase